MNQPNKERFKTSVGGQALMEGISIEDQSTSARPMPLPRTELLPL